GERLNVPALDAGDATRLVASRLGSDEQTSRNVVGIIGSEAASTPFQLLEAMRALEARADLSREADGSWTLAERARTAPPAFRLEQRMADVDPSVVRLLA